MVMMIVISVTMKKASKMTIKDERKDPLIQKTKYVQKMLQMTMMLTAAIKVKKAKQMRNPKNEKKEGYHNLHKTMNLVNLSIQKYKLGQVNTVFFDLIMQKEISKKVQLGENNNPQQITHPI